MQILPTFTPVLFGSPPVSSSRPPNTDSSTTHTDSQHTHDSQTTADKQQVESLRQQAELQELKARDREVRAHEAAHAAAAGSVATSGPNFTFQRGPDGRQYAIGGEVNIDTSPVPGDPEATIQKAQTIRSAALAPANPSAQDRAVAAQASQLEAQARRELQQERTEQIQDSANKTLSPDSQSIPTTPRIDLFA